MDKVQWERTLLRSRWGDRKRCLKKDSNVESILPMRAKRCGFGLKILKHFDTEQSLNLKRLYHLLPQVDMRMIFDALKRDIRAAMDGEDVASNIEKKEEEPEKKDEEPSTSHHLKEISPYFSLYKYRL